MMHKMAMVGLVLCLSLVAAACGDDDDGTVAGTSAPEITGAWARTSPMLAEAGAAYLQITSAEDDRLVAASVDASVAAVVEIHETVMAEGEMAPMDDEIADDEMADGEHGGAMTMQEVEGGLEIPAGTTVALEPGGLHIMMLELVEPLEVGQTFDLTLTFETAGAQIVSVEVRDDAP